MEQNDTGRFVSALEGINSRSQDTIHRIVEEFGRTVRAIMTAAATIVIGLLIAAAIIIGTLRS